MSRRYYIGPWVETVEMKDGPVTYTPPDGTVGLVDLRPVTPTSAYGFFAVDDTVLGEDYDLVGETDLREYYPDAAKRAAWDAAFGVTANAAGTLLDWLWDLLTVDADPDGAERSKPLLPTHRGVLELHLAGHSRVRAQAWAKVPARARDKVLHVVQDDYERLVADVHQEADALRAEKESGKATEVEKLPGKVLDGYMRKYRVARESIVKEELRDDELTQRGKMTTELSDDFNRADSGTLGPDWDSLDDEYTINSNKANSPSGRNTAVHNTSLSSDDHRTQADVVGPRGNAGPTARDASSAGSFSGYVWRGGSWNDWSPELYRDATNLDSSCSNTTKTGRWVQCDGSTITAGIGATTEVTNSDPSGHSGRMKVGMFANNNVTSFDNWEAADLESGVAARSPFAPPFAQPIAQGFMA